MIRIGPITILRSSTAKAYSNVVKAAWPVHNMIWLYGENNTLPDGLANLPERDAALSDALSRAPMDFEDAPK